jgi:hypothetical protein
VTWPRRHHRPTDPRIGPRVMDFADQLDIAAALAGDVTHLLHRAPYIGLGGSRRGRVTCGRGGSASAGGQRPAGSGTPAEAPARVEILARAEAPAPATGTGWAAWPVDADRHAEASRSARRYDGVEDEAERAWSSRVDAAVHGMDDADRAGLDAWMQAHAASPVPHLYEARLVAAWETRQNTPTTDDAADSSAGVRDGLAAADRGEAPGVSCWDEAAAQQAPAWPEPADRHVDEL